MDNFQEKPTSLKFKLAKKLVLNKVRTALGF